MLVDVEAAYTFKALRVTVAGGGQNVLHAYPSTNPYAGILGVQYPENSPYGFNGRFYYLRALYAF